MNKLRLITELTPHLYELIDIINKVHVPMEGSLFFNDQVLDINFNQITENSFDKALSLAQFASNKNEILEIGFNSGFSALVFLLANENVKVTSVDICAYQYTIPCYEYLKSVFKDRINLVKGDSATMLPVIFETNSNFDGYFIDGGHSDEVSGTDFRKIIDNASNGIEVCADDYYFPIIKNIVAKHVQMGELEILADNDYNVFLKVKK